MLTRTVNKFLGVFLFACVLSIPFSLGFSKNGAARPGFIADSLLTTFQGSYLDTIAILSAETELDSITNVELLSEPERITGSGVILEDIVLYSCLDSIDSYFSSQKVYLFGNADLKYQDIHLVADFIEIDFSKNELRSTGLPDSMGVVRGLPVFTEGDQSFQAEEIRYNFETKKGRTINVITEEADGFLHGEIVKIMPDKIVYIAEGKFTTCDKPHPHFHIGFRKAKVIPKDKIVTSFAYLKIYDVPTPLVVPFGFFPNRTGQASGIILPSYGEYRNRGFYLENGGFYWGINEYLDLSLKGSIYSRGGWGFDVGSRYNIRYKYNGAFSIATATTIIGEENLPGYEKSKDYRVMWSHNQDPKARPNSVFRASVNAGSSQMSRYSPISDNDYLSNTFSSNISYSATWSGKYNFSANLRHSQNTISKTVDLSLPEIAFSVNRFYPLRRKTVVGQYKWYENITMNYTLNARNQVNTLDSLLFRQETLSEFKNGISHAIPISHSTRVFKHFNFSNSINYNERWYFQSIEKRWDYDDLESYSVVRGDTIYGRLVTDTITGFKAGRDFYYNTSLSTKIYGLVNFKRSGLRAIRHVVSPSVGFTYRPDFSTPFWGSYKTFDDPRFEQPQKYSIFEQGIYGSPPANQSGSINFAIGNNLEIKVRSKKDTITGERKIALIDRFTIGSSYDLAKDSVNFSDLTMSGSTRLFGNFDITYGSSWTPYAVDSAGVSINKFLWETDKKLLHLKNTSWSLSFNYNLSSADFGGKPSGNQLSNDNQGITDQVVNDSNSENSSMAVIQTSSNGDLNQHAIDYSIPWNLRFSYNFRYDSRNFMHTGVTNREYIQSLSFSGDIKLTSKWRIGFQSGYDFLRKELTYTSVDIYRDLHCWEMTFNWIPFGFRQSYNFTIKVKAAVLQDLKLSRRTHHLDRYN